MKKKDNGANTGATPKIPEKKSAGKTRIPWKKLTMRGILSAIVIAILVRNAILGNFEVVFTCALTLALFSIPLILDRKLGIDIPPILNAIVLLFIFAAEILGEIGSFYTKIPIWDTMLHTVNGFIMAAVGFSLVDFFNRSEHMTFRLSPVFLSVIAFCFSMTVGVLWEFFEFGMDSFFGTDMQKDFIVNTINTVKLNPDGLNKVVSIKIESLYVNGDDWMARFGGYLDIGIIDTMKDLLVNFIGATVFSVIGYFYVKKRGQGKFARHFIPVVKDHIPASSRKEKIGEKISDFFTGDTYEPDCFNRSAQTDKTGKADNDVPQGSASQNGDVPPDIDEGSEKQG